MRIFEIGLSHGDAPMETRARLAFTKKKQREIMRRIQSGTKADECVILSTCNRCEFYLAARRDIRGEFIAFLNMLAGTDISKYVKARADADAVRYLFETASGLNSMIIGEDQILGQVKDAHAAARDAGTARIYMNTLFRLAVTGAKRVKTDTLLSKTPVSVATLAIKKCAEILGTLKDKHIMIIGATGKIGGIVYKDLISDGAARVYVLSRTRGSVPFADFDGARVLDYSARYDFLDGMDAVISATASPHLTLSRAAVSSALSSCRKRAFIDLAVPRDIDIEADDFNIYVNIDDLRGLSAENNALKAAEAEKARVILKRYINDFLVWQVFHENKRFIDAYGSALPDRARGDFLKSIYNKKANCSYTEFKKFIEELKETNEYKNRYA